MVVALVVEALVIEPLIKTEEVAKRLVEVALVKTPVEATVAPIGVLLMVPLSIVRPSATIGPVIALLNKFKDPETDKLFVLRVVIVELAIVVVVKLVLVVNVITPFTNCMYGVPVTVVVAE